jgi:hypothetical protein
MERAEDIAREEEPRGARRRSREPVEVGGVEDRAAEAARTLKEAQKKILANIDKPPAFDVRVTFLFDLPKRGNAKQQQVYTVSLRDRTFGDVNHIHLGNHKATSSAEAKKKALAAFKRKLK